jgi:primosomal protein N' (replication factor Y)
MFVQVAVNVPLENRFSYEVPSELEEQIAMGKWVLIPFGKKKTTGYIVLIMLQADRDEIKPISAVLDDEPLFNEDDLGFFQWASDYYLYPLGRLLKEVLPGGIDTESNTWVSLTEKGRYTPATNHKSSRSGSEIMEHLQAYPQGLSLIKLKKFFPGKKIDSQIKRLEGSGWIVLEERLRRPAISLKKERFIRLLPPQSVEQDHLKQPTRREKEILEYLELKTDVSASNLTQKFKNAGIIIRSLQNKGWITVEERELMRTHKPLEVNENGYTRPVLNPDQSAACNAIFKSIASGNFSTYLLHGVTGSGKTEVYFRAIEEALKAGGSIIYLVPEIALTPQLLDRIRARFADHEIAVMHSGVSGAARYDQWRRISREEIRIIVGARSAVFSPARNLKLIIVDEEHDTSYKQDDRMRYNARDLAIIKASRISAVAVLGSATPAIRSYYHAANKKYHYLSLPRRIEDRPLPPVHIVDMKREINADGKTRMLSRPLLDGIRETLDREKQIMLFLNRRGFHTLVCCYSCGHVFQCLNCSVSLTHHAAEGVLRCHYCGFSVKALPLCPVCHDGRVGTFGMGTEKLEADAVELFPGARVERMDSDTTSGRGAYEKILRRFSKGEIDILIGTQMITKGHDFPNVLLVGIISADLSLNLPDFRAAEKTFQVMTQVAGRGGRGIDPGQVFIQTFNPDHYSVRLAGSHDYQSFYQEEIALRQSFSYPPYSRMVNLQISSNVLEKAVKGSEEIGKIARHLAARNKIEVMGPAEAPLARIKGRHRRQILLKGSNIRALHALVRNTLQLNTVRDIMVKIDVDPVNFM